MKSEGETLKHAIRGKGLTIQAAAGLLRITRQALHGQLVRANLDVDFKAQVKKKLGIDLSHINTGDASLLNSLQQTIKELEQRIKEKDRMIELLEENNRLLKGKKSG